jgi:hypothetical protein
MAFLKEPSKYKRSILAQLKHIVSKTMYRAVEILLTPCCTPVISNVDVECNGDSTQTVTVTLANNINLRGQGQVTLYYNGQPVTAPVIWTDSNVAEFLVNVNNGDVTEVTILLTMPTNSQDSVGVFLLSNIAIVNFPTCP